MAEDRRHYALLVSIPLFTAAILQLYPHFYYGVSWGLDQWPLIRNAQELILHSPTQLGGNPIFDSYNIYWPAVSIFGAESSLLLGVAPFQLMPIIVPLASAFTTLIFFCIVERLTKSALAACIASLLFATAGFNAIFYATVAKETFAEPLFMLALLLLLVKPEVRSGIVFSLVSFALALSHHVTMFIFLGIAFAMLVAKLALMVRGDHTFGKREIVFPVVASAILFLYLELYATQGLSGVVSPLLTLTGTLVTGALFALTLGVALKYTFAKRMRSLVLSGAILVGAAIVLLTVSTVKPILQQAPLIPTSLALLGIPYLIVGFLAIVGYKTVHDSVERGSFGLAAAWLGAVIALAGFTLLGTFAGVFLIHRFLFFLYAPALVFAGAAAASFAKAGAGQVRLRQVMTLVVVAALSVSSAYMSYSAVTGGNYVLGSYYGVTPSDYGGMKWVASNISPNSTLDGDTKVITILTGYLGMEVNPYQAYDFLKGYGAPSSPDFLLTYAEMNGNGYLGNIFAMTLPSGWQTRLENVSSIVFDNGDVILWG
ncbi:MAG: hypothetical protein M1368_12915 [Thaumarchaeota archaeon]|nr:hypothetical protein [Nitrososphaerota archaeon]